MRESTAIEHDVADDLFDRIGAFLADHGLSAEPAHYSFAYSVVSDPCGPLAAAVVELTDGGVRLSRNDIEKMGGDALLGAPIHHPRRTMRKIEAEAAAAAKQLVANTQAQVDGFADMVRSMRNDTNDFGRDLAAGAAAMERAPSLAGIDEIARITGAMLGRVRDAEIRLARATQEADILRERLAEAQDNACRDPLTGLANRRAFEEVSAARALDGTEHCIALCDVDRFKQINDRFGHAVGDRVLSALARTLQDACEGHLVVRHGGEEFAVLMLGLGLASGTALLDRARATVGAKRFRSRDDGVPLGQITMSVGITMLHADEAPAEALERADRLLYTAKDEGRDRICVG